ncbi:uracil-DNA glycosylase family protein [Alteromonas sp. C1M14]|uniref:uracil-DNA glycosylase family protein n=1 Tax=Alteromonas sp. C1M14 TaxID=2841567 RepID=UPI001C09437A|nr:uracil-DNA glycosylase family protein [Alteromonas sp. C1M14]MBU2976604.1 uracil-DNA glycosylase family protein [Alteromonas sp. C1M14]
MSDSQRCFSSLLSKIKHCQICQHALPYPPNPVLSASPHAAITLIGQAPGLKAHESSTPWDDASGTRLRQWLGLDASSFYNDSLLAIIPMGFCFPGYKNGADAPPRKECAPAWHNALLNFIRPQLMILVGRYAQQYYLPQFKTLTQAVNAQNKTVRGVNTLVLPHPSGRNNRWLAQHPWFEERVLPEVKETVARVIFEQS